MPLEVLLVEDSGGDVRLTQEAFHAVNPAVRLHVANDGIEALAFLSMREFSSTSLARILPCWI
jgi:two-component system, chemotaxis family, response regulator Rcp1